MSKQLNRKQVQNLIANYREYGYKDYEILSILEKINNPVGKYYQDVVKAGFKDDFVKDYGLDPNVPLTDKIKSRAESAFVGTGKAFAGLVELGLKADDMRNSVINKGISALTGKDTKVLSTNKADNYAKSVDDVIAQKDQRRKEVGRDGIDFVETGANIVSSLPKYVLGGGAGAAAKLTTRMGEQALRGGVDGLTQHASSNKERAINTAVGGLFGAGGEVVGAGVRTGATKAYNAVKGNKTAHAVEIENLGKQHGVNLSAGDISKNAVIRNTEIATEKIPVAGMSGYRQTQQNQARQSALNIQAKFEKALDETGFKALNQIQAKARQGNAKAQKVLDKANNATTPDEILQASLEVRAWREKNIAEKMYDNVQKELNKLPPTQNKTIAPTQTMAKLAEGEHIIKTSLAPDDEMARKIKGFMDNLNDPNRPKDYKNMRLLRSQIGDMAYKYDGIADPNPTLSNYLKDLRTAVEQDISNFVATSGNPAIKDAYKRADSFYRSIMQRQEKAHANAMNSSTPDQIYQTFIKKGQGDKAENFYNALDAKGQSAIRYKMIEEAIEKSYNPNLGENGVFSPAKFVGEFDRLAKPYERVFKGADKDEMDGFLKLMSHIERAGQFAENPANGSRLADYAVVGGTALAPVAMVKAGVATAMAKTLFTSKAGKRLLLAAKELPPNASGLDNLLKVAQKMSGVAGANLAVQVSGNLQEPTSDTPTDDYAMPDDNPLWDDDDWQDDEFLANQPADQWQNPFGQEQAPQQGLDFTAPQVADYLPSDFGSYGLGGGNPQGNPQDTPIGDTGGDVGGFGNDMGQPPPTSESPTMAIQSGLASLIPPPQNPANMGNYESYVQNAVGRIMQTPQMGFILDQLQSDNPDFARIEKAQMSLSHTPEWQNFVKNVPKELQEKVHGANILALLTNNQMSENSQFFNPTF